MLDGKLLFRRWTPWRMPKVFVCYRRAGAAGYAVGRVGDHLRKRLGEKNVIIDQDSIPPGVDYSRYLVNAIGECQAFIAIIDKDWLARDPSGRRRLDDPEDFVRKELGTAIDQKVRIIPVLLEGGVMPQNGDLPPEIGRVASFQAVTIYLEHFEASMKKLIEAIYPRRFGPLFLTKVIVAPLALSVCLWFLKPGNSVRNFQPPMPDNPAATKVATTGQVPGAESVAVIAQKISVNLPPGAEVTKTSLYAKSPGSLAWMPCDQTATDSFTCRDKTSVIANFEFRHPIKQSTAISVVAVNKGRNPRDIRLEVRYDNLSKK